MTEFGWKIVSTDPPHLGVGANIDKRYPKGPQPPERPMNRVLFVDDEPQILKGIARSLRNHRDEWDMSFATNADQALALMQNRPADVIVTDIRMPGMQGDALIERVHEMYPDTVPMALSGQCTQEQAIEISRRGVRFLAKPCDGTALAAAVTEAFVYRERRVTTFSVQAPAPAGGDDLRQAILLLAAAMVRNGILDTAEIPDSLRGLFLDSVSPATMAALMTDAPADAPETDPALEELRERLGSVTGEDGSWS